jgi:hypothetical protein
MRSVGYFGEKRSALPPSTTVFPSPSASDTIPSEDFWGGCG